MHIKEILIKDQLVECKKINLIVGTNNSGKTTILKELDTTLRNLNIGDSNKWIQSLTLETKDLTSTYTSFLDSIAPNIKDEVFIKLNIMRFYKGLCGVQFSDSLHNYLQNVGNDTSSILVNSNDTLFNNILREVVNLFFSFERCENRLDGQFSADISNTSDSKEQLIYVLSNNRKYLSKLQEHIYKIFGLQLIIEKLTNQPSMFLRLKPDIEIGSDRTDEEKAFLWQKHSPTVIDQGHGLWAYLRIYYSLFNPLKKITLIDEPEHYLHSTLKRSLGTEISKLSTNENKLSAKLENRTV